MAFDPKTYRDNRSGIGMPADDIATDTTQAWTAISLLKSIAARLGVGAAFTPSTDVAQGSTTAGQTGGLTQGAVTTAAPTYVDAKTNPLSLETDGDLRTHDTAATTLLTAIDGRVDGLETLIAATNTALTTIDGRVDGIEALIGTTNTTLTTIDGRVDGLETLVTSTNTKLDTAIGHLDGLETLIGTTNSSLTTIDGRVDTLETLIAATNTALGLEFASSASVTALASAATSAQLLAANAARKGLILNNTDANAVLVKYGTTASATSFTVRIAQNGYWEMPKPIYTGRIDAIWEGDGAGSLYATEM